MSDLQPTADVAVPTDAWLDLDTDGYPKMIALRSPTCKHQSQPA